MENDIFGRKNSLSLEIMNKDVLVATYKDQKLDIVNEKLLPIYLKSFNNVEGWLASRAIDAHRTNSRLIKKALRLSIYDDIASVLYVHGATITDTYWVRDIGSTLAYKDVSFGDNAFDQLAIRGRSDDFAIAGNSKSKHTPELTNIGSFEKCWRFDHGEWYMEKSENINAAFSEVYISRVGRMLGMSMADYELSEYGVRTKDFTKSGEYNFEPAESFIPESRSNDYGYIYEKLLLLCPQSAKPFVQMIFFDAVFYNPDRHLANFGLLTNPDTGECISFAPLFDHNIAFISRGYPERISSDVLIEDFKDFIRAHPETAEYVPAFNIEILERAAEGISDGIDVNRAIEYVVARYNLAIDIGRNSQEFDEVTRDDECL